MKQTPIVDRTLKKPWLLIAVYENLFDRYNSLKRQLSYSMTGAKNKNLPLTITAKARIEKMKDNIKEASQALIDYDQLIHNYIVNHNKPVKQLKTA